MSDTINMNPEPLPPSKNGYELSAQERGRLEAIQVSDPDDLLQPSRSSALPTSVVVSILCHVVLLAVTSITLFGDWQEYGVKMPAAIRAEKKQEREDEEQRLRDAKIEAARIEAVAAQGSGDDTANPDDGGNDDPSSGDPPPGEEERADPTSTFNLDDIDLGL